MQLRGKVPGIHIDSKKNSHMADDEQTALRDCIPEPEDDGGADHLVDSSVPSVSLPATDGAEVDLSAMFGTVVVYCFPKMGRTAAEPDPDGWEAIPGAYGCTEETCSFRDHYQELVGLGVTEVFGLSLQSSDHQQDAHSRVEPPYEFLSDSDRGLTDQLRLPTFENLDADLASKRVEEFVNSIVVGPREFALNLDQFHSVIVKPRSGVRINR